MIPASLNNIFAALEQHAPLQTQVGDALTAARGGTGVVPEACEFIGFLNDRMWLALQEATGDVEHSANVTAAIQGLHCRGMSLVVMIHADAAGRAQVRLGLPYRDDDAVHQWLSDTAPDTVWQPVEESWPTHLESVESHHEFLLPRTVAQPQPGADVPFLDRMLRLGGHSWSLMLLLTPVPEDDVRGVRITVGDAQLMVAESVQQSVSRNAAVSAVIENPQAAALAEHLVAWDQLCGDGVRVGMWGAVGFVSAADPVTAAQVVAMASHAAGPETAHGVMGRAQEWDVAQQQLGSGNPAALGADVSSDVGWLSSSEVASALMPPSVSLGDVTVRNGLPSGRTCVPCPEPLRLGSWLGTPLGAEVDVRDVAGHVFLAGTTGSGKSTTSRELLTQLWNDHGIPFLVVDPAKADYGEMSGHLRDGLRVVGGSELRMNVLQPWPGCDPVRHIAKVAQAFRGCFGMPQPVPYVANLLFEEAAQSAANGLSPTLHDVSARLDTLSHELGYVGEIAHNIQASLGLRLRMLLQPRRAPRVSGAGVPLWLVERPTVVELSDVGDEEERSFLAAMLMLYVADAARARRSSEVGHVTVVEEAHRLMPEPRHVNTEVGDPAAVVSGLMTQLLAEVRGYGESMWVVDQSPAAVAREVVRNTNVKIVHRVMDPDDQRTIGGALGLPEEDVSQLGSLSVGRAILGTRRLLQPQTVAVEPRPRASLESSVPAIPVASAPCHDAASDVAHHVSEGAGRFAELVAAVWATGATGIALLDDLVWVRDRYPGSAVTCLAQVGIRRHVATLVRLGQLEPAQAGSHADALWDRVVAWAGPVPHPAGDLDTALSSTGCPQRCVLRPVVESGGLPAMSRLRDAIRALTPQQSVERILIESHAIMEDLSRWTTNEIATAVGRCAGFVVAEEIGVTTELARQWAE